MTEQVCETSQSAGAAPDAAARGGRRVLYLSHDGALDPLGRSQILPYLVRLSALGERITLLTFEKKERLADREALARTRAACEAAGIRWTFLRYHRWPPLISTAYDLCRAWWRARRLMRQERIELIHARSYVAMGLGMMLNGTTGARVLFDMRELWVDGRVDGGAWPRGGWLHRLGKRVERWYLARAEGIVSLTRDGQGIVESFNYWPGTRPPIAVIPTCVDAERFAREADAAGARPEAWQCRRVIVYAGSIGSWYRFDAVIECFKVAAARRPDALLVVLTPQVEAARRACAAAGLTPAQVVVQTVDHDAMPRLLAWADVALYFITPSFAKRSSCPTKLGESLAAGVPVMTNPGIGDTDAVIRGARVGVLADRWTPEGYAEAWRAMDALLADGPALRARCRAAAKASFNVEDGVASYRRLYQELVPR